MKSAMFSRSRLLLAFVLALSWTAHAENSDATADPVTEVTEGTPANEIADPCSDILCLNDGKCKTEDGQAICECMEGWTGETCEEDDLRPELPPYKGSPFYTGLGNEVHAPNIQKLAYKGVVFKRAYCQYALCTPSRTSFLTGRRPTTSGVMGHMDYFRDQHADYVTLPQFFKHRKYASLGAGKIFHPLREEEWRSFDEFHEISEAQRHAYSKIGHPFMPVSDDSSEREVLPDESILEKALHYLRTFHRGHYNKENFYLAVGFMKPHLPWVAPKKFFDLYKPEDMKLPTANKASPLNCPNATWPRSLNPILKNYGDSSEIEGKITNTGAYNISVPDSFAREYRHGYFACISYVDSLIGELLQELKNLGLHNDTVIVFHSDHGYNLGEHGYWGKQTMFETTNHVPLIFHVPGVSSKTIYDLVELVDVFPTLADLTGYTDVVLPCDHSNKDRLCSEGKSLVKLIQGQPTEDGSDQRDAVVFNQIHGSDGDGFLLGKSVLTKAGRLTKWTVDSGEKTGDLLAEELYNLHLDPKETVNIVDRTEEKNIELKSHLDYYFNNN